ncbi:ABC transporter permease [Terrihabitans soli]|uniref:ABC transporter permease n=1 Tax=Terrihabitans soli TaxID=708113 RepID=A0A6S6QUF1_9HYPH|nr:ABC transporter permease [Terrihabitans soli]BCJ91557.1 ABC transporter permease [Terrihabitans soli]
MIDLYGFGHQMALGTWMTIQLALASLVLGLSLGLFGATLKSSSLRVLRWIGDFYSTVFRGIPELVVVLLIYFGSSGVLTAISGWFGGGYVELNPFAAGTLALGICFGAYATEVFRGALLTIPNGQMEAGQALGLGKTRIFWKIILPQLWRIALPGLGNLFMVMMKDTALVSVIGLEEVMRKASVATGVTKQPFTFYLTAALIYLGITVVATGVLHILEKRVNRGIRRVNA